MGNIFVTNLAYLNLILIVDILNAIMTKYLFLANKNTQFWKLNHVIFLRLSQDFPKILKRFSQDILKILLRFFSRFSRDFLKNFFKILLRSFSRFP